MVRVSRCMSTQHPDNVHAPFFSSSEVIYGNTEIAEAYYAYSHLGCDEQMWDNEGKEIDNQVVEKLITKYPDFFYKHVLGKDIYLTYRSPNPSVQRGQGKILLELLHSIPRAYDAVKAAGMDYAPIFEVILPMTTKSVEIERVKMYYKKIISGQENTRLVDGDINIKEWIGPIYPKSINIIPLYEDINSFLNVKGITKEYITFVQKTGEDVEYQRVFLARSDPALNYGEISAVLLAKIALSELTELEEETSIEILPILGVGSAPFRGNLTPLNTYNCTSEYPSVATFTIQSAFKYDYAFDTVKRGIEEIKDKNIGKPLIIDKKEALDIIGNIKKEYGIQIKEIADIVNTVALHIPERRKRHLHIGLYGYSRSTENGIRLPRAIKFCASLYSIGLPPELLGFGCITNKIWDKINEMYINVEEDLETAAKYLNKENLKYMPKSIKKSVENANEYINVEPDHRHEKITKEIYENIRKGRIREVKEKIEYAAWIRKFLG